MDNNFETNTIETNTVETNTVEADTVNETYQQPIPPEAPVDGKKGIAIGTLVAGIASIVCCCCYGCGIIPGGVAIILYLVNKDKISAENSGLAKAGFICGIVGVAVSVIYILLIIIGAIVGITMPTVTSYMNY